MTRLLIDIGGVVVRTPFELLDAIGSPGWTGPFDPDADQLWRSLQRGELTEREYWSRRAGEVFEGDEDLLPRLMGAVLDGPEERVVRPEVAAFVAEVDRPAALTNDLSAFHPPEWIERMTVLRRFDPLIDLSFEGVLKPDPAAFWLALWRLDEPPGDVLFVDDQPGNLAGAQSVGMRVEWFDVTDVPGSIARIRYSLGETAWAKVPAS